MLHGNHASYGSFKCSSFCAHHCFKDGSSKRTSDFEVPPSTCSNTTVHIASAQHSDAAAVPIKPIKKKTIFCTTQQSSLLNEIQKSW